MSTQRKWVIGYFIAFVIMIIMNYSAGSDVGNVADDNPTIIQPAGFAFSIWGMIYVLLLIWMIKLFFTKNEEQPLTQKLKYWPILNFLLNGIWIVVFTQQWMILSTIVILALLFTLIKIHTIISAELFHWYNRLPYSIYFAWVTIASIVNIFTLASNYNVESFLGMDEMIWTIIAIIAAVMIGIFVAWFFNDWLYPLIIIWPYLGIYVKSGGMEAGLDVTLALGVLALIITVIFFIMKKIKLVKP